MKKILLALALIAVALVVSCTAGTSSSSSTAATAAPSPAPAAAPAPAATADTTGKAAAQQLNIGFIATNLSAEAQARLAKQFEANAKGKGYKYTVLNSEGSIEKQAEQIENLVQMKVDAIVLALGHPTEVKPAIESANKAGIPVISINSGYMEGLVCDITSNDFVMGAKITTHLFDSMSQEGNIVAIKFTKNVGCRKRGEMLDAMLPEYPGITLLEDYTVVSPATYMEDTRRAMETFVTKYGDKIDAVWVAFDQLGYLCGDVLQEMGINDVMIVGVDGNEETFRRIQEGTFSATVAQPFEEMADKAIEIAEKMASGMDAKAAAGANVIYVDAPLVTADTL